MIKAIQIKSVDTITNKVYFIDNLRNMLILLYLSINHPQIIIIGIDENSGSNKSSPAALTSNEKLV
jgi:hypothetical protein